MIRKGAYPALMCQKKIVTLRLNTNNFMII